MNAYRILGYQVGEVEPSHAAWAARVHPDDREAAEAVQATAKLEHKEFISEYRIIRRDDGSVRWVLARGLFLYDADKPVRMIGLKRRHHRSATSRSKHSACVSPSCSTAPAI